MIYAARVGARSARRIRASPDSKGYRNPPLPLCGHLPGDQFSKELEQDNGRFRELLGTLGMLGTTP